MGLVDSGGLIHFPAWFESKRADLPYNVTMSDDIVALAKLAVRQANLINLLSLQLADQACLIEPKLERCPKCHVEPITVEHLLLKVKLCDRCAAESIVKSGRNYVDAYIANPDDPLNVARASMMNENEWVDLPDAEKVRRLVDYVKIIKELEVTRDRMH